MMRKFSIKKLNKEQRKLRRRILEISFARQLSHLGSCLTSVDIIDAIYKTKKKEEKFVLSNGHAGIALYVILEKHDYIKNPKMIDKLNIHPDRNLTYDIHVSTGSLGQGLPIALGLAIADKNKNVYCMLSDGECAEGSVWEALRVGWEKKVQNLKIVINANGWSAYDSVNLPYLMKRLRAFGYKISKVDGHNHKEIINSLKKKDPYPTIIFAFTQVEQFPFLKGQDAHYYTMTQKDYEVALKLLDEN